MSTNDTNWPRLADLFAAMLSGDPRTLDRFGQWRADLPTYGGEAPADADGVWSWDARHVLVGTCPHDLTLAPRPEPEPEPGRGRWYATEIYPDENLEIRTEPGEQAGGLIATVHSRATIAEQERIGREIAALPELVALVRYFYGFSARGFVPPGSVPVYRKARRVLELIDRSDAGDALLERTKGRPAAPEAGS